MGQNFIACDREQSFLLPPDVREWLPEDHFAWFVLDAVAQMDLGAFMATHNLRKLHLHHLTAASTEPDGRGRRRRRLLVVRCTSR